jgi:putative FmdB family regulatory protein
MPIYEFTCENCGNQFEKIVSFSAASTPDCPSCSSSRVKRQLSKPAIHFKGNGWYITDSKTGNGNDANGNGKAKSSENGNESTSTEAKSDTKGDTTSSEPAKSKNTEATAVKTDV